MERSEKILSFLKEIEKLKLVERGISCTDGRRENSAEHSWHVAMFLVLFEKELPPELDRVKMLKMALIHDLVEIYAGDTFAYDSERKKTQQEREFVSAKKLFSQLPEDLEKELSEMFEEYDLRETPEAKFVMSFDKLQPILQNISNEGVDWKKHNLSIHDLDNYKRKYMTHNDKILKAYEMLLKEAKEKNLI